MVNHVVECYLIKYLDKIFSEGRRTVNELKNITRVITILTISIISISKNEFLRERSIYYKFKHIFHSSKQINKYLKNICNDINVCKSDLNISNSNRGLIYGLTNFNCNDININSMSQISTDANYILVVEKQSIFHYLHSIKFYKILPCILITGSGFPSFNIRKLLNQLITKTKLSTLYLGDYDPYGILIYLTYISAMDYYNIDRFNYLGITDSDLKLVSDYNRIKQTNYDVNMIDMLITRLKSEKNTRVKLIDLLIKMKEMRFKVEIEALQCIGHDFLENYIIKKALRSEVI